MIFSKKGLPAIMIIFLVLAGCAGIPVRPALQENIRIPSGKIGRKWRHRRPSGFEEDS